MQERSRHRISGSIFLLALAVIFLPMLFDGASPPEADIPVPPQPRTPPAVANFEDIVPDTAVVQEVAELRAEVDADGYLTTGDQARFGEPRLHEEGDDTAVWAVQAASFKDQSNARALRQRMRDQGLEAFISSIKRNNQVLHRVAVGPLLSRADGEQIKARVNSEFELEAQIVAMEP